MRSMIPRGDPDQLWCPKPLNNPVQTTHNAYSRQGKVHFDTKPFTIEVVQHIEGAELSPIRKLVLHEVH